MGIINGLLNSLNGVWVIRGLPVWLQILIVIPSCFALCVLANICSQILFKDPTAPPVVFHYVPFVGSTVSYGMEPYAFFADCKERYGDVFTFILLGKRITVPLGAKGNELVFNSKLSEVSAEEAYTGFTTPVFGKGVVYDVPNHVLMEQKRFVKFGLSTENFKLYAPMIAAETRDYLNKDGYFGLAGGKTTGTVDVMRSMSELTLYTASRTLQGKEVRAGFDHTYAQLYHDLDKGFRPINFMFPWMPLPNNGKRDRAQRKMANCFIALIEKRKASKERPDSDMIWNLMNQSYKNGRALSDTEIAHIMIALLMAGQHTSSATSAWILLRLAEQPNLIADLYQEQLKVYGQDLTPLTYETLSQCSLLSYVIRETLRMHPPLHSLMRKVKAPLSVPGTNYIIQKDTFILAAPGSSALDPDNFEDPTSFLPWRWANRKETVDTEQVDYGYGLVSKGTQSPYLPFGAGRHRCIGEQFAYLQLGTIIATIVRELTWTLPPGQTKASLPDYSTMIAQAKTPANIVWKKRS